MDTIPYNKVGNAKPESMADIAENEGISEEEWRAQNLPASKLEFRWRYTNKTIHLYERRLRSLGSFNVGPAVQAWVRSRLEWVRDNKLYEMPDGVIVLTIDPEGMVDTQLEELHPAPQFTRAMLDADEVPGTLWVAKDGQLLVGQGFQQTAKGGDLVVVQQNRAAQNLGAFFLAYPLQLVRCHVAVVGKAHGHIVRVAVHLSLIHISEPTRP